MMPLLKLTACWSPRRPANAVSVIVTEILINDFEFFCTECPQRVLSARD
jgi:hypothetical protein